MTPDDRQLDGNTPPPTFAKVGDWVRYWLGQRSLEYPLDRPKEGSKWIQLPVDECTDAALPDMPIRFQDEARRGALRKAFEGVARSLDMRALRKSDEGGSIYGYVRDLETLFDLWQYLRPLQRDVDGRTAAIAKLVDEWLAAHPTTAVSRNDILVMLDRDEPPDELAA